METLLTNKRFIQASTVLIVLLSLFTLALFINELKESSYVGRGSQPPATISVSGEGEVLAVSDIASLYVTISKDGATTKEAKAQLDESLTKTLAYLKDQKIEDKDIKSEYGGIDPKYGQEKAISCYSYPCPPQPQARIIGYTASQSIVVKIRDVDTANDISTGLANLGITNISGPTFSIDNEDSFNAQARAMAIDDAREKGKVLADQLNVRLGKIVSFSDNGGPFYPMYEKAGNSMDAMATSVRAPELPKGENKITASVTITYEIR